MKLVTRAEWGARDRRYLNEGNLAEKSTGHWNGPTITIGGKNTWDHSICSSLVRGIQNFHMDGQGWSDIAYNFLVCPHEYVFEGRGINAMNGANGTTYGNQTSHAICFLAGEENPFAEEEKRAFRDAVAHISEHSNAPDDVAQGHRDHKSTECPGDERYSWIHEGMPLKETPEPEPKPRKKGHMLILHIDRKGEANDELWLLGSRQPVKLENEKDFWTLAGAEVPVVKLSAALSRELIQPREAADNN